MKNEKWGRGKKECHPTGGQPLAGKNEKFNGGLALGFNPGEREWRNEELKSTARSSQTLTYNGPLPLVQSIACWDLV